MILLIQYVEKKIENIIYNLNNLKNLNKYIFDINDKEDNDNSIVKKCLKSYIMPF